VANIYQILPTRWRQKSTGIDLELNYVTVTLCIAVSLLAYFKKQYYRYLHLNIMTIAAYVSTFVATFIFKKCYLINICRVGLFIRNFCGAKFFRT